MPNSMGISMSTETKHSPIAQLRRFIEAYPTLFGMIVGLFLVVGVIVIVDWFPRADEAWSRHNEDVRSAFCSLGLFAIMIFWFGRLRRRGAFVFWAAISSFFVLHAAGVILYSILVHPLLLREWMTILIVEPFVIIFALDWLTKRFGRTHLHHRSHKSEPTGENENI